MELEILNRHAATAGLSRSAYLRELFLSNEIHVHYEVVADMKILRDILKEYGKIGSNLNQIARYFNTGGKDPWLWKKKSAIVLLICSILLYLFLLCRAKTINTFCPAVNRPFSSGC